jgi:transposase
MGGDERLSQFRQLSMVAASHVAHPCRVGKPDVVLGHPEHGSGLGKLRWVVERTFAWLHFFRRLRIRWQRRPELHEAFMHLGCAVICQRYLRATWPDAASLKGG